MNWSLLKKYFFLPTRNARPARRAPAPLVRRRAKLQLERLECRLSPAILITQSSSPVFYNDLTPPAGAPSLTDMYEAYKITNTGPTSYADVWATIGNFVGGVVSLSATEPGQVNLGPLAAGASTTAFFYLKSNATTNSAQTYTVSAFDGAPVAANLLTAQALAFTSVSNTQTASPNQVTSVTSGPTPPVLGGIVTMTVTGSTGTLGSTNAAIFTPAVFESWRADAYQMISSSVSFTGGNTGTFNDTLSFNLTNSATSDYTAVYKFRAVGTTATPTAVAPVGFFNSGNPIKHTDTGTSNFTALAPIQPANNTTTLTKSVSPGTLSAAGQVTYTLTLTNSDPTTDSSIDHFVDTLPSSPANLTYVAGSSTFSGGSIGDPVISGQTLTWTGLFTVPHASSVSLVFTANVPGTDGTYTNNAVAFLGAIQIDGTLNTTDNVPATATFTEGNFPPTTNNHTVTMVEDATYTFTSSDFPYSDPDGQPFQSVTVVSLPGSGVLKLSGVAVTAGQVIPVGQIGNLTFAPAAGGTGNPYTSFQFKVSDANASSSAATETIIVTPIPPTTANHTVTMVENSTYTFTSSDFPFTDPNSDGETLQSVTVTTLPSVGSLKLSGTAVTAGQVIPVGQIGSLTFTPAAGATGNSYATFQFTVNDGTASSSAATETVVVTPIPPTTANHTVTTVENSTYTFVSTDFPFTDPDADGETLQSVTVTTLPGAGSLKLSGTAVTAGQVIPVGQIGNLTFTPAAGATGNPYATFQFTVSDGTASSSAATETVIVTPIPPTTANNTVTIVEGSTYTFTSADFPFTDPDNDGETLQSVTVVNLPGAGTLELAGVAVTVGQVIPVGQIGNLTFTPAPGGFGNPYASFQFTVSDGTASSSAATETVIVTPVPPTSADHTVTMVENTTYTFTSADFPFTDPDNDGETLQSVTIVSLPGAGTLQLGGINVTVGQVITVGQIGSLTFTPAVGDFGNPYASFLFTVSDGTASSAAATETVVVTPVPPTTANHTVTTAVNTPYNFTSADFPFNDPDNDGETLQGVRIDSLPAVGTLTLNGNPVGVGQVIPVGQLANLAYTPPVNQVGTPLTSFNFAVFDGDLFSSDAVMSIAIPAAPPVPVKTIITTSEASTAGNNVAIGEIVRYQLAVQMPETTSLNFQIVDVLPVGLRFLGNTRVAFVHAAGTTMTSSDAAVNGLAGLNIIGTSPTGVTATAVLPTDAAHISGGAGDGVAVTFSLGSITNNDTAPADADFIVIQFNVLVDNVPANTTGATDTNTSYSLVNGSGSAVSNPVDVVIVQPSITNTTKSVTSTGRDPTDQVSYKVTYSNTGNAGAFDVRIIDSLPSTLTLIPGSVVVKRNGVTIGTGFTNSSTGNTLDLTLAWVGTSDGIEISYTATIKATTAAGTTIPNTVNLTYTSLPGPSGTISNPTGQSTPGTSGAIDGERGGSGVGGNGYLGTSSQTITVNSSTLTGFVYQDLNGNGVFQPLSPNNEPALPNVTVTLTGKDFLGNTVNLVTTTNSTGQYTFSNLLPSDPTTAYKITETQPASFLNGKETPPSANFSGTIGTSSSVGTLVQFSDVYSSIRIGRESRLTGSNYNFGELTLTNTVPPPQTFPGDTVHFFCRSTPTEISINNPNPADLMEVTLSVTPGTATLRLANTGGLTFTAGGNNTAMMTFRGTANAINLALSNLAFTPALYFSGPTTLTIISQDLDSIGNPVPGVVATNTVPITITPVNHLPTIQAPATQATNENVPVVFSSANGNSIQLGDPDVNPAVQVERLILTTTRGTATLSTTAGLTSVSGNGTASVIVTGTINALNAGVNGLTFTPTNNTFGNASLVVTLNDLANTVGPAMQAGKTIAISVAQVNQPPVVLGPASVTRSGGTVVFSGATLISVADSDAGTSIEQVTLNVTTGTLTLGSTIGLTSVTGNGTMSITIRGSLTYLNNALRGLRYTGSATTLSVILDDLGNTGLGGPLSDTLDISIL